MKGFLRNPAWLVLALTNCSSAAELPQPRFEAQTIDRHVEIGYGVAIGDGRPDIVASGRSTHNLVIYWNRTLIKR